MGWVYAMMCALMAATVAGLGLMIYTVWCGLRHAPRTGRVPSAACRSRRRFDIGDAERQ